MDAQIRVVAATPKLFGEPRDHVAGESLVAPAHDDTRRLVDDEQIRIVGEHAPSARLGEERKCHDRSAFAERVSLSRQRACRRDA
jgi:hypothetical protein